MRYVGTKTFVLQDGVWIDTTFDSERMATVPVTFGSEGYFDLLTARPEWGEYMALGTRVIFVAEGVAYEVVEEEAPPPPTPRPLGTPVRDWTPTPGQTPAPALPTSTPASGGGGTPCPGAAALGLGLVAAAVWLRLRA